MALLYSVGSRLMNSDARAVTDEVFHVGADETFVKEGPSERCTTNSTAFLERKVVDAVANHFGKTPAGWEQLLFETGAATNDTIIYACTLARQTQRNPLSTCLVLSTVMQAFQSADTHTDTD